MTVVALPFPPEILFIILVALASDFSNGFHDAANSIATIVSTRVLSPRQAVVWAAFFNFIAFAVFGVHVAKTIAKGTVDPAVVTPEIIRAITVPEPVNAMLLLTPALAALARRPRTRCRAYTISS